MSRSAWLKSPQKVTEINPVPILPITIKALKLIAAEYQRKGMRPIWRNTHFQNLVIFARVLQNSSKIVITDNTDILIHEAKQRPIGQQLFLRHQYYRFVFEITPYNSDCLSIMRIQWVTPQQIQMNLAQIVQEEMVGQLHRHMLERLGEGQGEEKKVDSGRKKDEILGVIGRFSRFTLADIEKEVECETEMLSQILDQLCGEGKIGDMGKDYMVMSNQV